MENTDENPFETASNLILNKHAPGVLLLTCSPFMYHGEVESFGKIARAVGGSKRLAA